MNLTVGGVVRAIRTHRGLTLDELSAETGISISYLSLIERDRREPSLSNLGTLAEAFGLPVGVLLLLGTDTSRLEKSDAEISEQILDVIRKLLQSDERYPASI